jgi:hypothetical protein
MERANKNMLSRKVTIRLSPEVFNKLNVGYKNSTKRKLSEYIRAILMDKPITVYVRNQSYDDFVAEMILLRNELKAIGNNFNQAVKKLHVMEHETEIKIWAIVNENSKQLFFKKIEEINSKISEIEGKWSQE